MVALRPLVVDDFDDFCQLNSDEQVMRFFPAPLTVDQSQAFFEKIEFHHQKYGFGYWAVEIDGRFSGLTGLLHSSFDTPIGPHIEIGWRLMPWVWGKGHATAAAREALRRGLEDFGVQCVYAYTTASNTRSENVMKRIGMHRRTDLDFDHPNTVGWWGQRHIVYRIEMS